MEVTESDSIVEYENTIGDGDVFYIDAAGRGRQ